MLDTFATPLKRKRDDEAYTPNHARHIQTPSFLRRSSGLFAPRLGTLGEVEEDGSTGGRDLPTKKRGLVRSLSSIIQNLRDQQEEDLDEELDLLREIEEDGDTAGSVQQSRSAKESKDTAPDLTVDDSQADMPLGPDKGVESEEEEEVAGDGLDHNGQPRKVWKKKGLKRQTKRVISMSATCLLENLTLTPAVRPVRHKAKQAPEHLTESNALAQSIPETQIDNAEDDESDFVDSDTEAVKKRKASETRPRDSKVPEKADASQKPARKIKATAHANFRRLKIKNKNAKANGRGRFGKR